MTPLQLTNPKGIILMKFRHWTRARGMVQGAHSRNLEVVGSSCATNTK